MTVKNAASANVQKHSHRRVHPLHVTGPRDIAAVIRNLRLNGPQTVVNLQLQWIALSGCRANEAQCAKNCEINLNDMTWKIPAERRKVAQDLVIPITQGMAELLLAVEKNQPALAKGPQDYVFTTKLGAPLATTSIDRVARRAGTSLVAIRHAFAEWAKLEGKFPSGLIDARLGYGSSAVEAAFSRTSNLPKRNVSTTLRQWFFEFRLGLALVSWAG